MKGRNFAVILVVVLIAITLIGQRGSESIPSPVGNPVLSGTAQNLAAGGKPSKAATKAISDPVKQGLLEAGHNLIDESGARANESAREYEQAAPVSGELLVALVRLSEFAAHFGLHVIAVILAFGGIVTIVFSVMRNIQRFG